MTSISRFESGPWGAELLTVVARFNRFATRCARHGLPTAQARLLAQIDDWGPARIGDLAHADHSSQPAMTRQVRRLETAGLIRCCPDCRDSRAVLVALTTAGRRALTDVREARAAVLEPLLARLSAAEQLQVQSAIEGLSTLLDRAAELDDAADTGSLPNAPS